MKRKSIPDSNEEDKNDVKKAKIEMETEKKVYTTLEDFKAYFKEGLKKMNRKMLEEYCIQKMCEVIGQTSDLGKLRQQLIVQEEFVKAYKTKVESLSKQLKDLEIVKGRIVHDLKRLESKSINDLVPVKITRSVGLQVSLNPNKTKPVQLTPPPKPIPSRTQNYIHQAKRPFLPAKPAASPVQQKPVQKINTPPRIIQQKSPQIVHPKIVHPKTPETNSILTKALQHKSPAAVHPPTQVAPAPKPVVSIDLTDEEDTGKKVTPVPTPTQNIRVIQHNISSAPMSTNQTVVATTVAANRVAYVVNGQHAGAPQQLITLAPTGTPARPGFKNIMLKPVQTTSMCKFKFLLI